MPNNKIPFRYRVLRFCFPIIEKVLPKVAQKIAIEIFFSPPRTSLSQEAQEFLNQSNKFKVMVDGKAVVAYAWGESSKKILLVHGWGGKATQFNSLIKHLKRAGYEVIAFDVPGHGASEGNYCDLLLFEEAIQEINNTVGPFEAIIGHSMGGIAGLLAQRNGININKLITISSPSIASDVLYEFRRKLNAAEPTTKAIEEYIQSKYGLPFSEASGEYIASQLQNQIPTLLIHDIDDKQVNVKNMIALKKKLPHAEHFHSQGYGHNYILQNPQMMEKIERFVCQ